MIVLGLDPSFKGFGICLVDTETDVIETFKISQDIGKLGFAEICDSVDKILYELDCYLKGRTIDLVVTETPPPTAKFSAGLYALDYAVSRRLENKYGAEVYGVSCSYIGHIHKNRKWTKTMSVNLAKELVDVFKDNGFASGVKFESNQCEALIIACRACIIAGLDIGNSIISKNIKFKDKLEFNL